MWEPGLSFCLGIFCPRPSCLVFFVGFFFLSNQREKAKRPACLASGPTVRGTKAGNAETVPSSCRASRLSYLHKTAERDIIGLINPARLPGLFPRSLCSSEGGTGKSQGGPVTGGAFPGTGGRWSPKARPGSALARAGRAQRGGEGPRAALAALPAPSPASGERHRPRRGSRGSRGTRPAPQPWGGGESVPASARQTDFRGL